VHLAVAKLPIATKATEIIPTIAMVECIVQGCKKETGEKQMI
jgi:hypothetical protein